jgi:tetratricopeptide (TPR) repeat protein
MAEAPQSPARAAAPAAVALLVCAAAVAAYWPALVGGFIWDDDGHVTRASLQPLHGLWSIWFQPGATQQYYPVLHTLFWFEHRLWGDSAAGYHVANLVLHLGGCLLFYRLLRRLAVPGALFAATVFALHPVCVESVAWISEQKNTLSLVFYMASALAFLRFDEGRRIRDYGSATAFFILALLSKSVTASLPAALIVILWWRRRLSWRSAAPLVPWLVLSAAAAIITPWVERTFVGAYGAAFELSAVQRVLIAGRAVWFYLGKILWPADLVFIYPRWNVDALAAWQYVFPLTALAGLAVVWSLRNRTRGPLAACLLFVGTLFPALGFVNVYPFVFSYVADHFQYLAAAGAIAALSAALATALGRVPTVQVRLGAAIVLAVLSVLTWRQSSKYRDIEVFYRTILARNPDCWLAHDNLGVVLVQKGKFDEAEGHYKEAIRLNPTYPEAYSNYGNVLARTGHWLEAADEYALALKARPAFSAAEYNWGNAMNDAGMYGEAERHFRNALKLQPDYADARYSLGNALANSGNLRGAIPEYEAALLLRPDSPECHANLGLALAESGRIAEALPHITEAIRLRPGYAEAHAYLGFALSGAGRYDEALAAYADALRVGPNSPEIHYQMAAALQKLGRTSEAADQFAEARRLGERR